MSTQHPDNVRQPFFVENSVIGGDDEIKEAFYTFSNLKIKEQLWDCEGKEVDNFVIEKLLTKYDDYFRRHEIGKDVFVTLRGPNPRVEKNKGKLLLETLESIPRNYDTAYHFYQKDIAPIFEISIPMVSSAHEVLMVKEYYDKFITGKKLKKVNNTAIKEWVGDFKPDTINVIPLIEDKEHMLRAAEITGEYLDKAKIEGHQRVWLARSDPSLNYGNLSAILLNKIALQDLHYLSEKKSVDLYPIIGCGSAPFRGNFRPDNVKNAMAAYPSVQTFTAQSAFKYDYPEELVRKAVEKIEEAKMGKPMEVDEKKAREMIEKVSSEYQKQVTQIAPLVNQMSSYVPERRKRKLHIGLFGYSRKQTGVSLPRAIKFCGAMYSFGLPPELLGMSSLTEKDYDFISTVTASFDEDMKDSLKYFNEESLKLLPEKIQKQVKSVASRFEHETDERHKKVTSLILKDFRANSFIGMSEKVEQAAAIRGFLG
ncbi:TPA: phosphoenolpyruvate carboxylase [Candidatus Woesearchaeota archaeon]|nr:Phosphoenolpyruvate carboxylase [archaeon GW2011_AR15]MBS3103686.1 phosphoenolpyruvate carboxylase [Candidatus Woesearchaeota archaeon]HIH41712.1 phosphoenolpyruvate carboxylase [Candidatus Woesearchaeota archaeon]